MKIIEEIVGPERAQQLLGINTHNRNRRSRAVQRYNRDMRDGKWRPGSVIRVGRTPDGREILLDGQNRLLAIIESGTEQVFYVVHGHTLSDQRVFDTGVKRTLGDTLTLNEYKNATTLAAAINWYCKISQRMSTQEELTIDEALDILQANPDLPDSIQPTQPASRRLKIQPGMTAALHYMMTEIDSDSADEFWSKLDSCANLSETDPIYVLHRALAKNATASAGQGKLSPTTKCAYLIKGWNSYINGEQIKLMRWTRGGANKEAFPLLSGGEGVELPCKCSTSESGAKVFCLQHGIEEGLGNLREMLG